ncbi:MAG TPA: hypothetical protein VFB58_13905 [Chloroflexota bacterium]|nr:hypothetical protein [Chloroflexota bacterium]
MPSLTNAILPVAMTVALAVSLGACSTRPAGTGLDLAMAPKGTVVGGIEPCEGPPIRHGPRYAAGTVTVLAGRASWIHRRHQGRRWTFPHRVVATTRVRRNQTYRFILPPGHYVLQGRYSPPGNIEPFTQVTVKAGHTVHANIPDICR